MDDENAKNTEDFGRFDSRKYRHALVVLSWILLLAVFLRLYGISREDSGFDEISTIKYLSEPSLVEFLAKVRISNPPLQPLYPTMEYYWAAWIGSSDSSLRFLSIIPGLLSVLLIYRLGEQIQSKRAGLLAAFLLCISPTHIYYSLEIRMYAQVLCLLLFSLVCTIQIARSRGVVWWILHTAATVLIVWTHILGALILPCEAVFLFWYLGRERIRYSFSWCVLQMLAVATLVPWFFTIDYGYIEEQYVKFGLPTVFAYGKGIFGYSLQETFVLWLAQQPLDSASPLIRVVLRCLNTVTLTAYAASYVILVYRLYRSRKAESAQGPEREYLGKVILVLGVVFVPVCLLFFVSYVWQPSVLPRYVLISLLGLYLVLAIVLDSIRRPMLRRTAIAVIVITTSLQTLAFLQVPSRPPWSDVFHAAAQEPVPFVGLHAYGSTLYYMKMVADHHFEADLVENRLARVDGTRILFYKNFDDLGLYLLDSYAKGRPASTRAMDVVVTVGREAYAEVTTYFEQNRIQFREEVIPTHGSLHYLRIEGKATGGN